MSQGNWRGTDAVCQPSLTDVGRQARHSVRIVKTNVFNILIRSKVAPQGRGVLYCYCIIYDSDT
jgi:hypothetical protein